MKKIVDNCEEFFNSIKLNGIYEYSKAIKITKDEMIMTYCDETGDHKIVKQLNKQRKD